MHGSMCCDSAPGQHSAAIAGWLMAGRAENTHSSLQALTFIHDWAVTVHLEEEMTAFSMSADL